MKIFLPILFAMNSTLALGETLKLTYKGMIGDVGVFKDEQCNSIFVQAYWNIPNTDAHFIEHTSEGALIVREHLIKEIIPFDKKCDVETPVASKK